MSVGAEWKLSATKVAGDLRLTVACRGPFPQKASIRFMVRQKHALAEPTIQFFSGPVSFTDSDSRARCSFPIQDLVAHVDVNGIAKVGALMLDYKNAPGSNIWNGLVFVCVCVCVLRSSAVCQCPVRPSESTPTTSTTTCAEMTNPDCSA